MFLAHTSNPAGQQHPHHIQNLYLMMMNHYFLWTSVGKVTFTLRFWPQFTEIASVVSIL
jgi:hypothetical protein